MKFGFFGFLDLFAIRPFWYVMGKNKAPSRMGVFTTLVTFGYVIWAIIYLSSDLVQRKNPVTTQSSLSAVTVDEPLVLDLDNFQYIYGIINDYHGVYDETLYTVKAILWDNDGNGHDLKMTKCQPEELRKYYKFTGDLVCLDPSQKNITLQGINSYVDVTFYPCQNETEDGGSCQPKEKIDELLNSVTFYLFIPMYSIVPTDYENPLRKSWTYFSYGIGSGMQKLISPVMKQIQLVTDDGWLVSSYNSFTQLVYHHLLYDVIPGDEYWMDITFFSLGDLEIYTRRYSKIQDFLAQLAGLTQGIIAALAILLLPYLRFKLYEMVGNEIFYVKLDQNPKDPLEKLEDMENVQSIKSLDKLDNKKRIKDENQIIEESGHESIKLENNQSQNEAPEDAEIEVNDIKKDSINISFPSLYDENFSKYEEENDCEENPTPESNLVEEKMKIDSNPEDYDVELESPKTKRKIIRKDKISRTKTILIDPDSKDKEVFKVGYFEYLKSFFIESPKVELMSRMTEEVIKKLDITTFLKKVIEFDNLKLMMLTKEQKILFDNFKRPKIILLGKKELLGYENQKKKKFEYVFYVDKGLESYKGNAELLGQAYENTKSSKKRTHLDNQLYEYFKKYYYHHHTSHRSEHD